MHGNLSLKAIDKAILPPSRAGKVGVLERVTTRLSIATYSIILIMAILSSFGFGSRSIYSAIALALVGILTVVWSALAISVVISLKNTFANAFDRIDIAISLEEEYITILASLPAITLIKRAERIELESKLKKQRAGLSAALPVITTAAIGLYDSGVKAFMWPELPLFTPLFYSALLGGLIGAVTLLLFSARLDRIAALLRFAATRLDDNRSNVSMADLDSNKNVGTVLADS